MKNKNKQMKIGIVLGFLFLFLGTISAFSVSAPNLENDKVYLYPGATLDLRFVLQDSGQSTDITAKADILQGGEVIELLDRKNEYLISPGQKVPVMFRVTIPEDAIIGESKWSVRLGFSKAVGGGVGLSFGSVIEQSFEVITGEPIPEEESKKSFWWLYVLIVVLALGTALLIKKLKRKKK